MFGGCPAINFSAATSGPLYLALFNAVLTYISHKDRPKAPTYCCVHTRDARSSELSHRLLPTGPEANSRKYHLYHICATNYHQHGPSSTAHRPQPIRTNEVFGHLIQHIYRDPNHPLLPLITVRQKERQHHRNRRHEFTKSLIPKHSGRDDFLAALPAVHLLRKEQEFPKRLP
jgi:hypothetical protein